MHSKHLIRAFGLLFFFFIGFLVVRAFMIPPSFGDYGHFRGDDVQSQRNKPVHHGGRESCKPCHEEVFNKVMAASHVKVQCENCHAPVTDHAIADEKIKDMPKDRTAVLCIRCHEYLAARPKTQPQVKILGHLKEMDEQFSPEVCVSCHNPHAPKEDL